MRAKLYSGTAGERGCQDIVRGSVVLRWAERHLQVGGQLVVYGPALGKSGLVRARAKSAAAL